MAKYEIRNGVGIIPESATKIEDCAFEGCKELREVAIPQWVREIEEFAFYDCSSLTSIIIPPSVTEIEDSAFYGCSALATVKVSKHTEIGEDVFENCPEVEIEYY